MIRLPISIEVQRFARIVALSIACTSGFVSTNAWAEPTSTERNLAAALFDEARTLMGDGKIDEACAKFAESQRLDPGGGTLLNLALCHEKQGKIATAWSEFRDARAAAKKDKRPDRETAADDEIKKLEPQLFKVSVIVPPEAKVNGLSVEIDGLPLSEAAWGIPFPLDPGTRVVVAKAPGFREWKGSVEIGKAAGKAEVTIPVLEKEAANGIAPPNDTKPVGPTNTNSSSSVATNVVTAPKTEKDASSSSRRQTGFILGGIGLAFLGAGAITGGIAIHEDSQTDERCKNGCTDPNDVGLSKQAVNLGNVSTAAFAVGIAGVAIGTIVILTAPKNAPVKASLSVGPQFVSVNGNF